MHALEVANCDAHLGLKKRLTEGETMTEIAAILAQIQKSKDPVEAVKRLVLAHGGQWCDPENAKGLFEIQLMGLAGIGPSVAAAVDDWLMQAKDAVFEAAGTG